MSYSVLIDGRPVSFGNSTRKESKFSWRLLEGVLAPIQAWEIPVALCRRIVTEKVGQEVEIELNGKVFKRILVLGNMPSDDPQTLLILLTDVRWYFTRGWLIRDANIRRRVGDKVNLQNDGGPVDANPIVQDVQYLAYSIDAGTQPFKWSVFSQNVMDAATRAVQGRPSITWTRDSTTAVADDTIIEEVGIDDSMPAGLSRAISSLPGRGMIVDEEGTIHLSDRMPGAELGIVSRFPPPLLGKGSLAKVDLSALRPKGGYRVLWTPELDIRLDFPAGTGVGPNDPYLENVLRVSEPSLLIPAGSWGSARTVGYGTWITFDEAYAAWGAPADPVMGSGPLTDDFVRSYFLGPMLEGTYVTRFNLTDDPVWRARIDQVRACYRTVFRINPRFWARVLSARPVCAAIWDPTKGIQAPSPVFCNNARKPSQRSFAAGIATAAWNITSYPASGLLKDGTRARANLEFLDGDMGIIEIVWTRDMTGMYDESAPSALEVEPSYDIRRDPLGEGLAWVDSKLVSSTEFKLSAVAAFVPAGPNDERRCYEVDIPLADVVETLGSPFVTADDAHGPDQVIRIRNNGSRSARFAQSDDPDLLQASLGVFGAGQQPEFVSAAVPVVNGAVLVPINYESEVLPLSKAVCASALAVLTDSTRGTQGMPFDETTFLYPIGTINSVTYQVQSDEAIVIVSCADPQPLIDPMAKLPAAARRILAREIQPSATR